MKKLFGVWMLLCALCAFTACSDDDDDKLPIEGLKIPSFTAPVKPGESVTIEGQGFTQASEIWFRALATRAENSGDVKATVTGVTANGITFSAPMVFGQQAVLLKEAGKEYTLGEMQFKEKSGDEEKVIILPKKVMKIVVVENGNISSAASHTYTYDNGKVTKIHYVAEGSNDDYSCQYKDGKVSIAGTLNGSIEIKDGKAVQMITDDDFISEENTFSYTPAGYLDYITTKWTEDGEYSYTETETFSVVNGSIISYREKEDGVEITSIDYEYGDYSRLNNLNIDLWNILTDCLHGSDAGKAFAFGLTGNRVKYLPVRLHETDKDEEEPDDFYLDFHYIMNGEYITNIKLVDKEEETSVAWEIQIYYED